MHLEFDMSSLEFDVDGIDEIIKKEVELTCRDAETMAKQLCPVDTGTLQRSITADPVEEQGDEIIGKVYTDGVRYAGYVEFGTVYSDAQEFFYPACNSATKGIEERILDLIMDEIDNG